MKFDKPACSLTELVAIWQARGLIVDDPERAVRLLAHINYYRLAGYLLPFETDHATHQVRAGTRLEAVLDLYTFDRELRLMMLDALERIEVSLRTQWAFHIAHKLGPHGYLDPLNARSTGEFAKHLARLADDVARSKEVFCQHYRGKYSDPDLPPTWMACEVMSLGQLSQWYALLRPMSVRKEIARTYDLDQQVLESALHHLTYVRNLCAHHSRLWNREFVVTWQLPRKGATSLVSALGVPGSRRLYNTLCLTRYLLDIASPGHSWKERIEALMDRHLPDLAAMGYPEDWRARALWQ